MRPTTAGLASAVIVGLVFGSGTICRGQVAPDVRPSKKAVSFAPGSISGTVLDESGKPVVGAMVSALGATTSVALTDREGRFELLTLAPGPYLVRAHLTGFVAPRPQVVDVHPSGRTLSSIALRRSADSALPLAASVAIPTGDSQAPPQNAVETSGIAPAPVDDDHSETAWRIRHGRRGVLKSVTIPDDLLADADASLPDAHGFTPVDFVGRAAESSARLATNFFTDTPFSGQVNLLTSSSFDTPQQLLSASTLTRGIANVSLTAPVNDQADWTVRGALTEADISSWVVAGAYRTRGPATHSLDLGLSYSTERYSGGNPLALRDVTDGTRNAGAVYAFDTFALTPALSVTYGARYDRYDYLRRSNLLSPRFEVSAAPGQHMRFNAMFSRREVAPGAEEFVPPAETGIWLPPQRTFSAIEAGRQLDAERATHVALDAERDFGRSTVVLKAFHQHVDGQLATLFGTESSTLDGVANVGHYLVGPVGQANATGCAAAIRGVLSQYVKGSVEYSFARAQLTPAANGLQYLVLLAPSAMRSGPESIHDISTSIETSVPETSTRVIILYRVGNGYARPAPAGTPGSDRPRVDSRFDVQVRQSLPFMDFTSAKWEMLLAVRNFFRDAATEQTVYDELFVVRPPKRIVGGLTMRF